MVLIAEGNFSQFKKLPSVTFLDSELICSPFFFLLGFPGSEEFHCESQISECSQLQVPFLMAKFMNQYPGNYIFIQLPCPGAHNNESDPGWDPDRQCKKA